MKTMLRNFLSVFRRFKMASVLNVLGLSVAFTAFIVIMMQVTYDLGFNKSIKDVDRIFRIETSLDGHRYAISSRIMPEDLASKSPSVVESAIIDPYFADANTGSAFFSVERNGGDVWFMEDALDVSAGFVHLFSFEMTEGQADAIKEPNTVLIPESMAHKMFGNEPAIQKRMTGDGFAWTIGGVYRDFPDNTSVNNVIYKEISPERDRYAGYGTLNFVAYIKLDTPEAAENLIETYVESVEDEVVKNGIFSFSLTPVSRLHYDMGSEFDTVPKTSMTTLWILIGIAVVVLLIATINFTNYSIALTPLRVKSINTQKVLGATERKLRGSLAIEAVLVCLIAWLLSLGLTHLLSLTSLTSLLDVDIYLPNHLPLLLCVGGVALLVGLFAGIYPAFYATSFAPALALKGSFGLSPKGKQLRNSLVGIQFVASFILIITALFMYLQVRYMQKASLGYNKDHLVVVDVNDDIRKNGGAFKDELLRSSAIESVAFACDLLSGTDYYGKFSRNWKGENIIFQMAGVDENYLETVGISLTEGRGFLPTDKSAEKMPALYIFNEKARKEFGFSAGDKLGEGQIIGFIPDINITSLRKEIEPMAFTLYGNYQFKELDYAYIRIKAGSNLYDAIGFIKTALQGFSPHYAFNVRPYDTILQAVYDKENKMTLLIAWFSLIAILISIVGVFGLVVFESEYKRKEVGIRKVMGSTTPEILAMFNARYIKILMVCFIVAAPVAWYTIDSWLRSFAYKTPLYWWVFALSFLLVTMITTATVTFQSWQVANANPVDSIKTE
ncbi:MAG: ABC transporter permease [Tannerellaceae bacterium]|jgi:putative ABC transport system permease protein|nr:ABC transporter permease [Tannerellaceae bacterium]